MTPPNIDAGGTRTKCSPSAQCLEILAPPQGIRPASSVTHVLGNLDPMPSFRTGIGEVPGVLGAAEIRSAARYSLANF